MTSANSAQHRSRSANELPRQLQTSHSALVLAPAWRTGFARLLSKSKSDSIVIGRRMPMAIGACSRSEDAMWSEPLWKTQLRLIWMSRLRNGNC